MTTNQIIENQQRDALREQFKEELQAIDAREGSVKFESNSLNVGDLIHDSWVCSYASFFGEMQLFFYKRSEGRQQEADESLIAAWADNSMCWQDQLVGRKFTSQQLAQYCLTKLLSFR